MKKTIRLAHPGISQETIDHIGSVIKSGNLVQGKCVIELEKKAAAYTGAKHARMVSSGTAALHIALCALGVGDKDEVIVPAFTFPATANVVELCGATPIMADIRPDTFCINEDLIENLITPRTKAIMPVHEFGTPAAMDKICKTAQKHNLYVIEDAACSLGTRLGQKHTGTFGNFGCFSFHPRKSITTGEGGMLVFDDENMCAKIDALRNHGMQNGDFVLPGFNYRMTDFQAAMGLGQFGKMDEITANNNTLADLYAQQLATCGWIKTPPKIPGTVQTFQTYHVMLDEKINRDGLKNFLLQHNIQTNFGAHCLAEVKYYKTQYGLLPETFPNASKAYHQGLALPLGPHIDANDVKYVCNTVKSFTP